MSAPDRIWLDWPDANRGDVVYDEPPERDTQPGQTEYIRADLHDAAIAAEHIGKAEALNAVGIGNFNHDHIDRGDARTADGLRELVGDQSGAGAQAHVSGTVSGLYE